MTWLTGWTYCKSHIINGSSAGAQTDYQGAIKVYRDSGGADGTETVNGTLMGKVSCNLHCNQDYSDIRFTLEDSSHSLSYWIEESNSTYAIFWVEVDSIPVSPGTKTIYMYYGKDNETTTSNGPATFLFFDNFSSSPNGWSLTNAVISNGELQVNTNNHGVAYKQRTDTESNFRWKFRGKCTSTNGGWTARPFGSSAYSPDVANFDSLPHYKGYDYYYSTMSVCEFHTPSNQVADLGNIARDQNYHLFEVTKSGSTYTVRWDGTSASATDASSISDWYVRFRGGQWGYSTERLYVDWVFISKFVSPEPSHGDWIVETQGGDLVVGNLTVNGTTTAYNVIEGKQSFPHIYPENNLGFYTPQQGEITVHDFLFTDTYNDPAIGAKFRLAHTETGGLDTNIYGALFRYPEASPAVVTSHHLIVRKDFLTRGMVNSYEGVIALHGGYQRWPGIEPPYNPMIYLARGGIYGNNNTLEIRKVDSVSPSIVWGWGDFACGNITSHGMLGVKSTNNVFAVTAGDNGVDQDTYLVPQNPSSGGLGLGSAAFPFKWIDVSVVAADHLNSLSAQGIKLYDELIPEDYVNIYPKNSNVCFCGLSDHYWNAVYTQYSCYHYTNTSWDAVDDLGLARNFKTVKETRKTPNGEEYQVDVISRESLKFLEDEEGFYRSYDVDGYLLSCIKTLVLRLETLEKQVQAKN